MVMFHAKMFSVNMLNFRARLAGLSFGISSDSFGA